MFLKTLRTIELLWNWRYWPMELLYLPLTLYILCVESLRTGHLFYFASANPLVPLGGFAADSKYAIIKRIPQRFRPQTLFIDRKVPYSEELSERILRAFEFPVIAKPDIGEGGFLVRKLNNIREWQAYHEQHDMAYLIQEFIDLPIELSISVNDASGKLEITGITEKRLVTLIGDGHSTIATLLKKRKSSHYCRKNILHLIGNKASEILPEGAVVQPVSIGNWNYGTEYFHRPEWNTEELQNLIASINETTGLFHYARYDLKCSDHDRTSMTMIPNGLKDGQFKILEINGVKGEAIHLYDPANSIIGAYREIFRHWKYIRRISQRNAGDGIKETRLREGIALLRKHRSIQKASLKPRISP
jgi:hypothetical protein